MTPHDKQVMMFSATLSPREIRPVCKKFMNDPMEIYVDDETKLTLHGLVQHYIKLQRARRTASSTTSSTRSMFNQVVIFVKSVPAVHVPRQAPHRVQLPSIAIHRGMQPGGAPRAVQVVQGGAQDGSSSPRTSSRAASTSSGSTSSSTTTCRTARTRTCTASAAPVGSAPRGWRSRLFQVCSRRASSVAPTRSHPLGRT